MYVRSFRMSVIRIAAESEVTGDCRVSGVVVSVWEAVETTWQTVRGDVRAAVAEGRGVGGLGVGKSPAGCVVLTGLAVTGDPITPGATGAVHSLCRGGGGILWTEVLGESPQWICR